MAPKRVLERDVEGNLMAYGDEGVRADHYACGGLLHAGWTATGRGTPSAHYEPGSLAAGGRAEVVALVERR
jgi:hypothetical protein